MPLGSLIHAFIHSFGAVSRYFYFSQSHFHAFALCRLLHGGLTGREGEGGEGKYQQRLPMGSAGRARIGCYPSHT